MGADSYQGPGSARNLLAATGTLEWLTNPRLAWSFLTVADPDAWHPVMTYLNQRRAAEADFEVGGRHYAVYAHDWRAEPPLACWTAWPSASSPTSGWRPWRPSCRRRCWSCPSRVQGGRPPGPARLHPPPPAALAADPLLRSRLATQAPGGARPPPPPSGPPNASACPSAPYRYHLAGGLRRVTERLWRAELYGPDD
jgi:hypothetical protein